MQNYSSRSTITLDYNPKTEQFILATDSEDELQLILEDINVDYQIEGKLKKKELNFNLI